MSSSFVSDSSPATFPPPPLHSSLATYEGIGFKTPSSSSSFPLAHPWSPKRKRSNNSPPTIEEIPGTSWRNNAAPRNASPHRERLAGSFGNMNLDERDDDESAVLVDDDSAAVAVERQDTMMMDDEAEAEARPAAKRKCAAVGTATFKAPLKDGNANRKLRSPPPPPLPPQSPPAGDTQGRKRLRSPPPPSHDYDDGAGEENKPQKTPQDSDDELSSDPDKYLYIPTLAQRYARSQKRLQQIKDCKARESREAREKRTAERRRRKSQSRMDAAASAQAAATKKAVRFND